jgi:hypothetical protein
MGQECTGGCDHTGVPCSAYPQLVAPWPCKPCISVTASGLVRVAQTRHTNLTGSCVHSHTHSVRGAVCPPAALGRGVRHARGAVWPHGGALWCLLLRGRIAPLLTSSSAACSAGILGRVQCPVPPKLPTTHRSCTRHAPRGPEPACTAPCHGRWCSSRGLSCAAWPKPGCTIALSCRSKWLRAVRNDVLRTTSLYLQHIPPIAVHATRGPGPARQGCKRWCDHLGVPLCRAQPPVSRPPTHW